MDQPAAHELTFLFTDIEGSTRLLHSLADEYGPMLAETRSLLARAVEAERGRVVDARADEFFAVFTCPRRALSAAAAAQRAFLAHAWPRGERVAVRMGLHTGVAASDLGDDFLGLEVHRASRIADGGHGGQILVSETTASLTDARVRDLGEYELDGFGTPERVFQLLADGLPSDFPKLRCARRRDARGVRVVIADDSVLIREGIARVLEEAGIDVVAQAGDPDELLRAVELAEPDVAIVDIRMPPSRSDEGLRAAREIRSRFPRVGALLLSQVVEPAYALDLLAGGRDRVGYLLKDRVGDIDAFAGAIVDVARGGCVLDPELGV